MAVEQGIPLFANLLNGAGLAQAVDDALGNPAVNFQVFGQMAGMERTGERPRQEFGQVSRG